MDKKKDVSHSSSSSILDAVESTIDSNPIYRGPSASASRAREKLVESVLAKDRDRRAAVLSDARLRDGKVGMSQYDRLFKRVYHVDFIDETRTVKVRVDCWLDDHKTALIEFTTKRCVKVGSEYGEWGNPEVVRMFEDFETLDLVLRWAIRLTDECVEHEFADDRAAPWKPQLEEE